MDHGRVRMKKGRQCRGFHQSRWWARVGLAGTAQEAALAGPVDVPLSLASCGGVSSVRGG